MKNWRVAGWYLKRKILSLTIKGFVNQKTKRTVNGSKPENEEDSKQVQTRKRREQWMGPNHRVVVIGLVHQENFQFWGAAYCCSWLNRLSTLFPLFIGTKECSLERSAGVSLKFNFRLRLLWLASETTLQSSLCIQRREVGKDQQVCLWGLISTLTLCSLRQKKH